jgi:hypothetical protein
MILEGEIELLLQTFVESVINAVINDGRLRTHL